MPINNIYEHPWVQIFHAATGVCFQLMWQTLPLPSPIALLLCWLFYEAQASQFLHWAATPMNSGSNYSLPYTTYRTRQEDLHRIQSDNASGWWCIRLMLLHLAMLGHQASLEFIHLRCLFPWGGGLLPRWRYSFNSKHQIRVTFISQHIYIYI